MPDLLSNHESIRVVKCFGYELLKLAKTVEGEAKFKAMMSDFESEYKRACKTDSVIKYRATVELMKRESAVWDGSNTFNYAR